MVVCLLLDLGLKAAFESKGQVVVVDCDPLDQVPDQPFIGVWRLFILYLIATQSPLTYYAVISTPQGSMNRRSSLA